MPKATPFLSLANGGEFSPRMDARVDFDKYPAAVSRALNLAATPQGGITMRPGTRFIQPVKNSADVGHIISFEPAASSSYVTEWGDLYVRFYRNQGRLAAQDVDTVITNGTFPVDIAGWTDQSINSASIAWSAGRMAITGMDDGVGWAEQQLTVSAADSATEHVVRFQVSGNPGAMLTVQVGSATLGFELFRSTGFGVGWHTITFNPNAVTAFLQFINEVSETTYIDNVSILTDEPIELPSPYAADDTSALRCTQSADVRYFFHSSYPVYKLERRGDTSWSLVSVFFEDGPWNEINPGSDLAGTNLITNGGFDNGFAGWTENLTGTGYVEFEADQKVVLLRRQAGAGTSAIRQAVSTPAGVTRLHVLHFQIVGGGTVVLSVGTAAGLADIAGPTNYNAGWYTISFTPTVVTTHLQFASAMNDGVVPGIAAVFMYSTNAHLFQASALTGSVTITALGDYEPFTELDEGRIIRLEFPGREPGWAVIGAVTTSQTVVCWTYRKFASTQPTESWRLGAWSHGTGWPHTGTLHSQRLMIGGNASRPQTIWGSQSADFENFRPDSWVDGATTTEDDDALDFTLAATKVSPIVWMESSRRLLVGTKSQQWAVSSRGPVLTPSDFNAEVQTSVKAADLAPVLVDTFGRFIGLSTRRVHGIGFSFEIDGFQSSDLTVLADHITRGRAAQIVYQEEPNSQTWVRLEDGTLACLTDKGSQNVAGWSPVEMGGTDALVESICVIPGGNATGQVYDSTDRDELWLIVSRTIGGVTKRYIEVMEGYFDGPNRARYDTFTEWRNAVRTAQADAFYVDCGITYQGVAVTSVSGLDHLEGQAVKIVADGAVHTDRVVSAGAVALDVPASTVHVGLGYGWRYRGLKLPFGSPTGSAVGQQKNLDDLVLVLRDATSFDYAVEFTGNAKDGSYATGSYGYYPISFRLPDDPLTEAVPLFSGEVSYPGDGGHDSDPRIILRGSQPLPWTLLGVGPKMTTSG